MKAGKMHNKKGNIKRGNIIQLGLGILIIILINIIGSFLFTRFDLTSEKRFSLSPATKELLKNTDDIVFFKVYLDGDFPAGFKRLRNSTKEMLDEFRAYNKNIQYEFINPSKSDDQKERNATYQMLVEKGLNPTDLQVSKKEGREQQIIFPGAIVSYKSRELPVELLKTQLGAPPEETLNNSIQGLEFTLANTIRNLTITLKHRIAFINGQGELSGKYILDVAQSLARQYDVEGITINSQLNSLAKRDTMPGGEISIRNKYQAIMIAKPDSAFSEKDKFIIDQFIMRGGRVLWLIDPVFATMDSLQKSESTVGIAQNLNLDDMLFNYGVRLNYDLVMDLNALPIPMRTGQVGNQPQIDFFPWYFFPVLTPLENNPIVKNLNAIKTEFISSMDTIKVPGVKKTILLRTSTYSRVVKVPVLISLSMLKKEPDERLFHDPPQTVAVLLEGRFKSNFLNRIPPEIQNSKEIGFKGESSPTKMIVVSDGDIIKNQLHYSKGYTLPLGYDQFTGQTFGNKEFIENTLNYLVDDSGLISIRSRELKLRMLDMAKVNKSRLGWQIFNTVFPVLLVVIYGLSTYFLRKRRYTGKPT
jgi:ABC-2 type transport system permease protein